MRVAALCLATLAGCTTTAPVPDPPRAAPSSDAITAIDYESSPCFGTCPVYRVHVAADGDGRFEGQRFTAVTGARDFTISRAAFADFRDRLAPYRPDGDRDIAQGAPACGPMATDSITVRVTWHRADGAAQHLSLYYGCMAPALRPMKAALRTAPKALPIAAFLGKH